MCILIGLSPAIFSLLIEVLMPLKYKGTFLVILFMIIFWIFGAIASYIAFVFYNPGLDNKEEQYMAFLMWLIYIILLPSVILSSYNYLPSAYRNGFLMLLFILCGLVIFIFVLIGFYNLWDKYNPFISIVIGIGIFIFMGWLFFFSSSNFIYMILLTISGITLLALICSLLIIWYERIKKKKLF